MILSQCVAAGVYGTNGVAVPLPAKMALKHGHVTAIILLQIMAGLIVLVMVYSTSHVSYQCVQVSNIYF